MLQTLGLERGRVGELTVRVIPGENPHLQDPECMHHLKHYTQGLPLPHPQPSPGREQQKQVRRTIGDLVFTSLAFLTMIDTEPPCKVFWSIPREGNTFVCLTCWQCPWPRVSPWWRIIVLLFFVSSCNKQVVLCVFHCDELILCSLQQH